MTSRAWYGVAAACLIAGICGAGWIVWSELSTIGNALTRVVAALVLALVTFLRRRRMLRLRAA